MTRAKTTGAEAAAPKAAPRVVTAGQEPRNRVAAVLGLQRAAGNAAATAAVEEANADRAKAAKAAKAIDDIAVGLYYDVEEGRDHLVMATCHAFANERELLQSKYLAMHRQSLRDHIVRRMSPSEQLVRILAYLYSGDDTEPYAEMGLSVIPRGTADDLILTLVEERRSLSARQMLADDYQKAFKGVHKRGDSLLQHLHDKGIAEWRYQKIQALLDHDLTKAEHIHFLLTSSAGVKAGFAVGILEEVWDQGPGAFGQLLADWDHWVRGNGWVEMGLRDAFMAKLWSDERRRAWDVFVAWTDRRDKSDKGGVGTTAAAAHLALLRAIGVTGHKMDGAAAVAAAGRLRAAKEAEIKKDPSKAKAWEEMRPALEKQLEAAFSEGVIGLFGDDGAVIEATVKLRRSPTPVDNAYFAMRRHDEKGVLNAVTDGWLAGVEATMEHDAVHPPAGDPRPPFSILEQGVPSHSDHWPKVMALLTRSGDHLSRGAARLKADLKGGLTTTQSSDLKEAYAFLQTIMARTNDRRLMEGVIATAFGSMVSFDSFVRRFERSVLRKDVLTLVFPDKTAGERLASAKEREAASHTGVLDKAGMALVELYDYVSGERTLDALDASMRRLVKMVQLTDASSPEVQAVMRREGARNLDDLSSITYERFKARLDEVRSVKGSAAETLGMVVDFAGRSLLVYLLGPVGLPGLMAALGAYSAGMVVREGFLGADYDLLSRGNLSTLAGEVAMFGFDESGVEQIIATVITPDLVLRWGGVAAAAGRDAKIAKGMQDAVKQATSKMAEKTVNDMIEGAAYPGIKDLMTRALHAAVTGLAKGSTAHITSTLKAQDDLATRFVANLKGIALNGPPPKAAMLMSVTKELTDMMASPDWVNMTVEQVAARLAKRAALSVVSALPVAAALTPLQQQTADRAMGAIKKDPTILLGFAKTDDNMMEAYRASRRGQRSTGESLWGFVRQGIEKPDAPPVKWTDKAGVEKSINLGKWVSDNAKLIDAVSVPTG